MRIGKVVSLILLISVAFIFTGGVIGYYLLMDGIKIKYSSLVSYDGTQIAIIIAEPEEKFNRFGSEKYGVVVAHGIISKAEANWPLIKGLARAGFTVVALDERGHGNSGGRLEELQIGKNEYKDVVKCAEYLKEKLRCKKVGLVGHSMGGLAVTRASIWAEKKGIEIAGTVAISPPMSDKESDAPPESLSYIQRLVYDIFLVKSEIVPYASELNVSGPPYNYLVVISEADEMIDLSNAEELCNLAGGAGKTSKADFEARNASDIYIIAKKDGAPTHGDTPRDSRVVKKTIEWIELSMGIDDKYDFNLSAFELEKDIMYFSLYLAVLGSYLLILPVYLCVKRSILKYNRKERKYLSWTLDQVVNFYIKKEEKPYNTFKLLIFLSLCCAAFFISPGITRVLGIPLLQTFLVVNVIVRDTLIAAGIIFILIFIFRFESPYDIFNWKNVKRFCISSLGATVVLFIFFLCLNLFDNFYNLNVKWMPFSFIPFVYERFTMFISMLIEVIFIISVIEYICRKQIQDKMFKAEYHYTAWNWFKSTVFITLIKSIFLTTAILGIFFTYYPTDFDRVFGLALLIIGFFCIGLFASECFLTLSYQNSRDFWFIILTIYTYFVWYVACWVLRV